MNKINPKFHIQNLSHNYQYGWIENRKITQIILEKYDINLKWNQITWFPGMIYQSPEDI